MLAQQTKILHKQLNEQTIIEQKSVKSIFGFVKNYDDGFDLEK